MRKTIKLDDIILDAGTQVRCAIHEPTVEDYAEAYKDGAKMPSVDVFADGNRYLLADGFHRALGAKRAGLKTIEAEVHSGTRSDCIKFALGTNVAHGLRRSPGDKRNAIKIALAEFPNLSNSAISEVCMVDDHTVADVRKLMESTSEIPRLETRIGTDGKERKAPPPAPPAAKQSTPTPKSAPAPKPQKKSPPPAMLDKTGYAIPQKLEGLWNRGSEIQELLSGISKVRSRLKTAQEENDPLFRGINFSRALGELDQAYADIKTRLPYAVCFTCQGQATANCTACGKTGIIGQFYFDTCVPSEVKQIRKRGQK